MIKYTEDKLRALGYSIKNAEIKNVELSMTDYSCLTLEITLDGYSWGVVYGGYCLGKWYGGTDDEDFEGSAEGEEAIMRVMATVGVTQLSKMKGKYVRVATKGWGECVKIIGNITKDVWFDYESYFNDKQRDADSGCMGTNEQAE